MARNIITGIDMGSSTIRVIIAEQKKNGGLHILGANQKQSLGIRRGFIVNFDDAVKCLESTVRATEKLAATPIKRGIVAVGGISLGSIKAKGMIMVSRADGEVTEYDIKRAIAQSEANLSNISNRRIIHSIPLSFKLDNNVILGRPAGMTGNKLEIETLFITCLNQHLADIVKAVESAGVAVDDIISSPLAMGHTVLTKHQKEVGCVLANIGAATVSVVVFEEGLPISLEVFPIGSTHITNDIALGLQVPLEEAEKIKIGYGNDSFPSKRKLSDIIDARLSDIFELIETHLKKINRHGMLPGGIILTGGGSNLFSLEEIAKSSLRLPAKIGTFSLESNHLQKNITVSSSNLREQIFNDPGWSVALGLCILAMNEGSSNGLSETSLIKRKVLKNIKHWFRSLLP